MTPPLPPTDEPLATAAVPDGKRRRRASLSRSVALVIGTVIVGTVLVTIFVPTMCGCSSEIAYVDAMKGDLRNLETAEESYFADSVSYETSTTAINFEPSSGVTITITSADSTGWAATASHNLTDKTCGIFVGSATAPIAGQREGEPTCVAAADSSARPPSRR